MRRHPGCLIALIGAAIATSAAAEEVRLKNGATFSAAVLRKSGHEVILKLPREQIATVDGRALPSPVVTGAAAPDLKGKDTSGTLRSVAAAKGRPVLLKFWASWCPYCRSDIPLVQRLYRTLHPEGLEVLAVSIDQDRQALTAFLAQQPLPYPVIPAFDPNDLSAALEHYEVESIPMYVLIDANGVITEIIRGAASEPTEEERRGGKDLETAVTTLVRAAARRNP